MHITNLGPNTLRIILLIFITFSFFCVYKILGLIETLIKKESKEHLMEYKFLSKKHICEELDKYEFQDWCEVILEKLGYSNIESSYDHKRSDINFILNSYNEKVYVITQLSTIDENTNSYDTFSKDELQCFIATLGHDNIEKGIIIITGEFSEDVISCVNTLPLKYSIILIDGNMLIQKYREFRKKEIHDYLKLGIET